MTSGYLPSTVGGGDLVAELASMATQAGPNAGLWPGLTIYRVYRAGNPVSAVLRRDTARLLRRARPA